MTKYGYARISTKDQNLAVQEEDLVKAGCEIIRSEVVTGTSLNDRQELKTLLEFVRPGDELIITRIDRLARSISDLQKIVSTLKDRGVALKATQQPVDTSTAAGKAFFDMLGVFAEFETNLRRERQAEGIRKAKARGVYRGRKPNIDKQAVQTLHAQGLGPTAIAREMNIGRASVYRVLAQVCSKGGCP